MDRILVIEDNKTLANLIAKKVKAELQCEVDIAYKQAEAKLFLQKYNYFVALCDLNLPDAPNGEVVDYVLNHNTRVLVLSGSIDKKVRTQLLQKNIIDYVSKSGVNDINYIIHTLKRLENNKRHKILVVDDSMVVRNQLKERLENLFFNVVTVAHGEEALNILDSIEVSLVLTDYNMPVMDGLELTKEIRKKYSKNDLSIIAISSNTDEELNALFLKSGANDYIKKPFSAEEFTCRVNNTIEALENIQIITNQARRDYLTGLYNRRYLLSHMHEYLEAKEEASAEKYAVAMIDIDNFKTINDTYGHEVGNEVIVSLSEILRSNTNHRDIVSRFGGEEFCIILKNINRFSAQEIFERLRQSVEENLFSTKDGTNISFTISVGVCIDNDEGIDESLNEADMMLYKAKNEGRNQVVIA